MDAFFKRNNLDYGLKLWRKSSFKKTICAFLFMSLVFKTYDIPYHSKNVNIGVMVTMDVTFDFFYSIVIYWTSGKIFSKKSEYFVFTYPPSHLSYLI